MKAILLAPLAFLRLFYQSIYLAMGQIWANKMRSTLTTIGIVIGVASVTTVIAALSGLKAKVLGEMESFGANTMYINVRRPNTGSLRHVSYWSLRFLPEQFDNLLDHCPSVDCFSRIGQIGYEAVSYGDKEIERVSITGVEPAYFKIEKRPIELGRALSVIDEMQLRQVCLIDSKMRDELNLDRDCIGETIMVGYHKFVIVGIIERQPNMFMGMDMSGGSYEILIPFKTVYKLNEPSIYIRAASKSPEVVDEARVELKFFLRKTRHIKPGEPDTFSIESVGSFIDSVNTIAVIVTSVAACIVGVSLLVGGVGIMNIMLVSVSERTREIGLRKAVGAKKSAILNQFLIEAVVLCLFGGLIGIGLGQFFTLIIANHPKIQLDTAYIPWQAIVISLGFCGTVGIFFGIFPAMKAAGLDPIEALRHE